MQHVTSGFLTITASAVLLLGCDSNRPLEPSREPDELALARRAQSGLATLTKLPSLGSNSEALAVDDAGTVIVGQSFDRAGMLYAVKWTLQGGSWVISTLPYSGSARATGVASSGDVAGYGASAPRHAVRWSAAGASTLLDCAGDLGASTASGISADGQIVVGAGAGLAAVWRSGGCREALPGLGDAGYASAATVNGDGTIVGGSSSASSSDVSVPVRWRVVDGQWQLQQLDNRTGRALGANGAGDLAGHVSDPCASESDCNRAVVWYADGSSLDLAATLGSERSVGFDINSAGEVVGWSTARGRTSAYLWSASSGTRLLSTKGSDSEARAVSDVRPDGTRLVVGMVAGTQAAVWAVRNP